jgi:hypothetical protein
MLRARPSEDLLIRNHLEATVSLVPANLEEAFVIVVSGPANS